jgi:hypothetical protein
MALTHDIHTELAEECLKIVNTTVTCLAIPAQSLKGNDQSPKDQSS